MTTGRKFGYYHMLNSWLFVLVQQSQAMSAKGLKQLKTDTRSGHRAYTYVPTYLLFYYIFF